jgi:hypothetical protein
MPGAGSEPLTVTALCLTRNRRRFLSRAIQCFLDQGYPYCRMIVLADGEDVRDLMPDDHRVSLVTTPEDRRPGTIGEKRNLGCSLITSELICHWDDDDWSASGRITDQVNRIMESNAAVVGYRSLAFYREDGTWHRYTADVGVQWAFGSSLMYRRDWWERHQFPCEQVGEDNDFVGQAANVRQLLAVESRDLMVGTIHAGNTSRKTVVGRPWKQIEPLTPAGFCIV